MFIYMLLYILTNLKIFVSYSRKDAGDFAEQIQNDFSSFGGFDI